jgi:hypothetical protein
MAWEHYGAALTDVLPALGTHAPMSAGEIDRMFGRVPHGLFLVVSKRLAANKLVPQNLLLMRILEHNHFKIPFPIRAVHQHNYTLIGGDYSRRAYQLEPALNTANAYAVLRR